MSEKKAKDEVYCKSLKGWERVANPLKDYPAAAEPLVFNDALKADGWDVVMEAQRVVWLEKKGQHLFVFGAHALMAADLPSALEEWQKLVTTFPNLS